MSFASTPSPTRRREEQEGQIDDSFQPHLEPPRYKDDEKKEDEGRLVDDIVVPYRKLPNISNTNTNSPVRPPAVDHHPSVYRTPPRKQSLPTDLDLSRGSKFPEDHTASTADITSSTANLKLDNGYTALSETLLARHDETKTKLSSPRRRPLRQDLVYYRVVYRGVVALLSGPDSKSPRSGHYLGYGEVFGSTQQIAIEGEEEAGMVANRSHSAIDNFLDSPPRSIFSQAGSISSIDTLHAKSPTNASHKPKNISPPKDCTNVAILVEEVLTGGYSKDVVNSETPIKSNLDGLLQTTAGAPDGSLGYVFSKQKNREIIQRLTGPPPKVEDGTFRYKIISSVPLPILTGPAWDAPRTKAMLLPGTFHEVSLRISLSEHSFVRDDEDQSDGVWFLRLSHRRGWIASHRQGRQQPVVKEMGSDNASDVGSIVSARSLLTDDVQSVVSSIAVSSVATPTAMARRRHRPPRRRREVDISRSHVHVTTPTKNTSRVGSDHHLYTPSSNVSRLSDDSSLDRRHHGHPVSPDVSHATHRSTASSTTVATTCHFLYRVTAPNGLAVLDAPHYQVNNLIRGKPLTHAAVDGKSILKTMPGRTATANYGHATIVDAASKKRTIPRGALFEASKRMESAGAFTQGAGLIKLSDNSGWAIIPHRRDLERQYQNFQGDISLVKEGEASRAVEEVGNTYNDGSSYRPTTRWFRIYSRAGAVVECAPHLSSTLADEDTSPTSSRASSIASGSTNHGSKHGGKESDVTSSVASTFVDAMLFRTPKKRDGEQSIMTSRQQDRLRKRPVEKELSLIIPCGNCVEVEKWVDLSIDQQSVEYARLAGGQGWIPLVRAGKSLLTPIARPEFRFGSFWFRVQAGRGMKVRLGPSTRAPSIKSEEDVHFRFECGEFLRSSEIMTIFSDNGQPVESYAKLYRNRHVRLHNGHEEHRSLQSMTAQSEWVQIHNENELFLEECAASGPPRIERHKQGWRYNVIPEEGLPVRKGPSFASETTGIRLFGGESVLINERVSPAGDKITWLRMKDGEGWLHDVDGAGNQVVIAHSLRHRARTIARSNRTTGPQEEVAYNTIIARLFHNEGGEPSRRSSTAAAHSSQNPLRRSNQL